MSSRWMGGFESVMCRNVRVMSICLSFLSAATATAQGRIDADIDRYRMAVQADPFLLRGGAAAEAAFDRFTEGSMAQAAAEIETKIDEFRRTGARLAQAVATDFRGLIRAREGLLREAMDSHQRALDLLQGLQGGDAQIARASAMTNLGVAYYFMGSYVDAERVFARAIVTAEGLGANDRDYRMTRARALNNYGLLRQEQGRLDDALGMFDRAAAAVGEKPRTDGERTLRAQALNNMARIYGLARSGPERRIDAARGNLEQARFLAQQAGDVLLEANILDSRAEILLGAEGEPPILRPLYEEALKVLDEALALEASLGKHSAPLVKAGLGRNRGRALALLGRAEALATLDEAIVAATNLRAPAFQLEAYQARGDLHRAAGRINLALIDYVKAVDFAEMSQPRGVHSTERETLRAVQQLYAKVVAAFLEKGDAASALRYLDRSKSESLRHELLKQSPRLAQADIESALAGAQGLLRQEEVLAEEVIREERKGNVEAGRRLRDLLDAVRAQVPVALGEIQQKYEEKYSQYFSVNPATLVSFKDRLPEGHLLVSYFAADDRLWVFLVSRSEGLRWRQVPGLKKTDLEDKIRRYRQEIARVHGPRIQWRIESWNRLEWQPLRELSHSLYGDLIAPIMSEWQRAQHIIIAPTGWLYYLPFHALGPYDPQTGLVHFAIHEKPISYLTTATLLEVALGPRKTRERSVLAIGNPLYSHEPPLRQLNFAEQEVEAMGRLFGSEAVVLKGSQATLGEFQTLLGAPGVQQSTQMVSKQSPVGAVATKFGIVHLATHGVLDANSVDSWLAFEGKSRLTPREIPSMRNLASAHLVTLSACETGLAGATPGTDVMSLAWYFNLASVPSVIVSLWAVDDVSTKDLMLTFYREVRDQDTLDKVSALQLAQKRLAEQPETRHPFFWAPFILIGDWR